MASKFKVGDKVRLIRNEQRYETRKVGDIGIVVGLGTVNDRRLRVEVNDMVLGQYAHELELIVEPRFKVGDRVKVRRTYEIGDFLQMEGAKPIDTGVVFEHDGDMCVRYDSTGGRDVIDDGCEVLEVLAPTPYAPRHTFASPSPSVAHIDAERIDAWMDDAVAKYKAQVTLGYDHPSHTTASGDALLIVENGQAKLYRLEGVKDVD